MFNHHNGKQRGVPHVLAFGVSAVRAGRQCESVEAPLAALHSSIQSRKPKCLQKYF